MIGVLWDFAQWRGDVPITRNPMQLVTIAGATKRVRRSRSLTPAELQMFVQHLDEPFRTLAQVSVCCGLRISEALALKWLDVKWKDGRLQIERGIVAGNVDDVKTEGSRRALFIASDVLNVLTTWRMVTEFTAESDWMFTSPATIARKPWSYDQVWRRYQRAALAAGIGKLGTHSMRHTFRSLLAAGTASCDTAKGEASRIHPNDHEHLRRRGDECAGGSHGKGLRTGPERHVGLCNVLRTKREQKVYQFPCRRGLRPSEKLAGIGKSL